MGAKYILALFWDSQLQAEKYAANENYTATRYPLIADERCPLPTTGQISVR
jgi:hypothetical protein